MATIYDTAAEARRRLLAGDTQTAQQVLYAYGRAVSDIQDRLRELVDAVQAAGGTATPAQLARLSQWSNLLQTLSDANDELAKQVGGSVKKQQLKALEYAAEDAQRQITQLADDAGGFVPFVQPVALEAMQALVGTTENGPLVKVIASNNYQTYTKTKRALTTGLAAGRDLRALAKEVQGIWGESLTRSLALVRTETLRAYREGSRAQYQANSDVVQGWRWLAARSTRTCPACLALDGQEFDLDQPMPAHVNCRCTMIPVLRDRDTPSTRQSGQAYFDGLSDADKRKIVGKAGLAAVKQGATLADFIHWREDNDWGRQALWSVPKGGNFRGGLPDPRPRLPNGKLADPKDAIAEAQKLFEDWRSGTTYGRSEYIKRGWAKAVLGSGGPKSYNFGELFAGFKGVADASEQALGKAMMNAAFREMPTLAPSVLATMKANPAYMEMNQPPYRSNHVQGTLNMAMDAERSIYAHEYMHHVEQVLDIADRHAAWIRSRATGPQQSLASLTGLNYDAWETALPDKFLDPYIGKIYGNNSTEVLTMGVEPFAVSDEALLAFIRDHEEHFWLVIAALMGL